MVCTRRAPKVNLLLPRQELNSLLFLKSQPTLPVRDVTQIPLVSIPIWDFYFDISEWHILSARAWTPALMLHLTNPCVNRKVLSLTKPKGKIYKTKSLGNYITLVLLIIPRCVIFKAPLSNYSALQPGGTQPETRCSNWAPSHWLAVP